MATRSNAIVPSGSTGLTPRSVFAEPQTEAKRHEQEQRNADPEQQTCMKCHYTGAAIILMRNLFLPCTMPVGRVMPASASAKHQTAIGRDSVGGHRLVAKLAVFWQAVLGEEAVI